MSYQVILHGSYFLDLIYTGLAEFPALGKEVFSQGFEIRAGACYYTALAFRRLGVACGWACDFGSDLFSRFVLELCQAEGIDGGLFTHLPYPVRRVTSVLSFPQDRAFASYVDPDYLPPAAPLVSRHAPAWLVLSHLSYGPGFAELAAACRAAGTRIYMDCQSDPATLATPGVREALGLVDVFAPNETEACHLSGCSDPSAALARLADQAPLVVMKRGPQGALACAGGQTWAAAALPVADVRDTTGAGDCFNAGFIYGMLGDLSLPGCLRAGSVCGSLAVAGGGAGAISSALQVEQYL